MYEKIMISLTGAMVSAGFVMAEMNNVITVAAKVAFFLFLILFCRTFYQILFGGGRKEVAA